jgi:hypothetical protein
MKRVGPELKVPEMKFPPFLSDLLFDLRQRGLLPIVALVVVAIAAVPFLLGGGSEEEEEASTPVAGASAVPGGASMGDSAHLAVVEAKPGLRDYHKRLAHRKATDPFKQRFTAPVVKGAKLNPQTETSSSSTTVTSTTESSTTPGESSPGSLPSGGGPPQGKPSLTFFAFAIDVRITKSGAGGSASGSSAASYSSPAATPGEDGSAARSQSETVVKHQVLPMTPLPGPKAPVVTYMGPADAKKGKALFLVSDQVKSVFGEARCVSGYQICQLLEIAPDVPVTLSYGANDVRYKLEVLKMVPVVTGHS